MFHLSPRGAATPEQRKAAQYGYIVLLTSFVVIATAAGFGRSTLSMVLPEMQRGLSLGYTQSGLLVASSMLAYVGFSLLVGFLGSKYGARRVVGSSTLVVGISMFLTGFSPSFEFALAMQVLLGIGGAGAVIPSMGLLASWFPISRRGLAAGVMTAGAGFAPLVLGIVIPLIVNLNAPMGWRYGWYYLGITTFLAGVLALVFLRDRPKEGAPSSPDTKRRWRRPTVPPVVGPRWSSAFRLHAIWHLGIIYLFFSFANNIFVTFLVLYLTREGGLTLAAAGSLFALWGALGMVSGPLWGAFSDRTGRKNGLATAFTLHAAAILLFVSPLPLAVVYLSIIIFGIVAWSHPAIIGAACGDYAGPRLSTAAFGILSIFSGLGQATGPALAGYLSDLTSSLFLGFVVAAGMHLLGLGATLFLKEPNGSLQAQDL